VPAGFPQILQNPGMKVVEKGRNAVLVCEATGEPAPAIAWVRDTVPIDLEVSTTYITFGPWIQLIISRDIYKCQNLLSENRNFAKRFLFHPLVRLGKVAIRATGSLFGNVMPGLRIRINFIGIRNQPFHFHSSFSTKKFNHLLFVLYSTTGTLYC
jgi:hypothetical protein